MAVNILLFHQMYAFAIRAYPGRAITDTPFVFFKTLRTNLKPAGTIPTKRFFLFTTMTFKLFSTATSCLSFLASHFLILLVTTHMVLNLFGVFAYLGDQPWLTYEKKVRCTSLLMKIFNTLQAVTSTEVNQAKSFTP